MNLDNPASLLLGICTSFALLAYFSLRLKKESNAENAEIYFTFSTSETLRGLGVFFLLIGHFSLFCVEGNQITEGWGNQAVILFLLISGIGLTMGSEGKKPTKLFIVKRLRKLVVPVWITLLLFYSLDYLLLRKVYPLNEVLLSFLGIISVHSPDGPLWFVTFLIVNYIIFYLVFFLNESITKRFLLMLFCCIGVSLYTNIGRSFSTVFPLGVLIASNRKALQNILNPFYASNSMIYIYIF